MNGLTGNIEYTCEKGTLYKGKKGYHWASKDGKIYHEYNPEYPDTSYSIKIKTIDASSMYDYISGVEVKEIRVLEIEDITLLGDLNIGEWDEVDCKEIKDIGSVAYVAKNNVALSIFVDKNGKCRSLTQLMIIMANILILGKDYDLYEHIPEELRNMTWIVGHANWQGKPISRNQELKLKMMDCWDTDPFKDYEAIRLDNIGIEVYWDDYDEYANPCRHYYWPHLCDDKHIFYTVEEGDLFKSLGIPEVDDKYCKEIAEAMSYKYEHKIS